MIITSKKFSVEGSTALSPQKKEVIITEDDKYKKIKESQKDILRRKKQIQLKRQARIIAFIFITFIIGFTVIYRYSKIYTLQREFANVQDKASVLKSQNDDLNKRLMMYSNIDEIQSKATEELHMIEPDNTKAVFVDLNKNSVKLQKNYGESNQGKSIVEVIESKLFFWR
ncbi:septum formation initiator family protein [Clostridium neuense]|uniref:Septum formation initiator family protein n=1 Tax=Clostridium neuense TaxID=1728934 RepID=A0ABW8TGI2_9CLOT